MQSWGLPSLVIPPGPGGWFPLTPCLLFSSQVVLKGDAKKLQLYGVSVQEQHVRGSRWVKQTAPSPAFSLDPFMGLCSPCLHIYLDQEKNHSSQHVINIWNSLCLESVQAESKGIPRGFG